MKTMGNKCSLNTLTLTSFLGTPLFITNDRIPLIDYTPLNTPTAGSFIFRAPQLSAGKLSAHWPT